MYSKFETTDQTLKRLSQESLEDMFKNARIASTKLKEVNQKTQQKTSEIYELLKEEDKLVEERKAGAIVAQPHPPAAFVTFQTI